MKLLKSILISILRPEINRRLVEPLTDLTNEAVKLGYLQGYQAAQEHNKYGQVN